MRNIAILIKNIRSSKQKAKYTQVINVFFNESKDFISVATTQSHSVTQTGTDVPLLEL